MSTLDPINFGLLDFAESLRTHFFSSHGPATSLTSATFEGAEKWRVSLRELVLSGGCAQETPQFHEQIGAEGQS